ncbi:MAG: hypothetical protein CVT94_14245 [Bacteroidetes bacterium HGW-Bacteroidetes-11]|jgi:hypothetical protein|nr:MAG: hypothetical protein CVT94_14245 [Bacteroidetes bacterium HGW-Bacteroidetes-11]
MFIFLSRHNEINLPMKTKTFFFLILMTLPFLMQAQVNTESQNFGIKFSGLVKNDFFRDTRETYTIREGNFVLYPKEINPDSDGKDINDKSSFNFLSIQSRITAKATAPDAFGAKTSGVIEADFFGNENAAFADVNGFRLRHAYVKLNWSKTELLTGQFWHPLFIPACFSGVVSFNTGVPMQPFSRNPQIRLTHKPGKISLTAALSAQRDFTSPSGSSALRYSSLPDVSALISWENSDKNKQNDIIAGLVVNYKSIQPLLFTTKGTQKFVTNEKVNGLSASLFVRYKSPVYTLKMQGVYGQNLYDLLQLGGFAIHTVTDTTRNTVEYTTINTASAWVEFQTNGDKVQFGLWGGYTQNLGSEKSILNYSNKVDGTEITSRGSNIKSVYRISPRIIFLRGSFNFATEIEFTGAAYATADENGKPNRDNFGIVTDAEYVHNFRLLFSVIYNF